MRKRCKGNSETADKPAKKKTTKNFGPKVTFGIFRPLRSRNLDADRVIEKIKAGDETYLETVYSMNRPIFTGWFRKQGHSDDRIAEWYQEAFFLFFEQVRQGKLTKIDAAVSTYLVGIGKNLNRKTRRNYWEEKVDKQGADILRVAEEAWDGDEEEQDSEAAEKVKRALKRMGETCREVLLLFYYRGFSMEAIAERTNLKNENTAKKTKYECLKKLREIYKTQ